MIQSLTDSQNQVLMAIAHHRGGVDWNALLAYLKAKRQMPPDLNGDLDALYKGGLMATRGLYTPAQKQAELDAAIAALKVAASKGLAFTWKTKDTFIYGLTPTGVDVVKLLMSVK